MKQFYPVVSSEEYDKKFGKNERQTDDNWERNKQEKALDRAWTTRNFEIDKFWQRSKFFWSFIGLVFGAFGAVKTKTVNMRDFLPYLDLYLIFLGGIVSVAWLLVIRGSKCWQENWEKHIECLEDAITGPMYKTVYCKDIKFYSVSRINEILAWVVIVIWFLLLINLIVTCDFISEIIKLFPVAKIIIQIIIPALLTAFCIYRMFTYGQSESGRYRTDPKGTFVDRTT
jgi:hypothetical protein